MDEEKETKLSELACKLSSMTSVLKGYCENYEEEVPEITNLIDFSEILHETNEELFNLL